MLQVFIKAMKIFSVICIKNKSMVLSLNMHDWKVRWWCKKQGSNTIDFILSVGNCAFILPDLKPELHHDFRVFTRNKYGDNFDRSYSITVGKPKGRSHFYTYEKTCIERIFFFSRISCRQNSNLLALHGRLYYWCMSYFVINYLLLLPSNPSIVVSKKNERQFWQ